VTAPSRPRRNAARTRRFTTTANVSAYVRLLALWAGLFACSEVDVVDQGSGGASAVAASASTGAGASGGGGDLFGGGAAPYPGDACPADPPAETTMCSPLGTLCTYGDSPAIDCRERYFCDETGWRRLMPGNGCTGDACPSAPPVDRDACGASSFLLCGYDEGSLCACEGDTWDCYEAPVGPGCPSIAPNAGTACSEAATCTYGAFGFCGWGITAKCTGGSAWWQWDWGPCSE